jgi:hypothetical protein
MLTERVRGASGLWQVSASQSYKGEDALGRTGGGRREEGGARAWRIIANPCSREKQETVES